MISTSEKKVKQLIKKFSYNELLVTCEKEGWRIPYSYELENQDLMHDEFWIADPIMDEDIMKSHSHISKIGSDGEHMVAHRNFMINAVVMVEEKVCEWIGSDEHGVYRTACDDIFVTFEGTYKKNRIKFCPFCGSKIKDAS